GRGAWPVVVVDAAGRALATWSDGDRGLVRQYVPGRGWIEGVAFGPDGDGAYNGPGRVAFDSSGRAVLVWERRAGGEFGPAVIWAGRGSRPTRSRRGRVGPSRPRWLSTTRATPPWPGSSTWARRRASG